MSLPRLMEPEWLDELPAHDARAIRSRRDLRLVNRLMFQTRIMTRLLFKHGADLRPRIVVELGGGDGTFFLGVARRLARRWPDVSVVLVDQQDLVTDTTRQSFRALGWRIDAVQGDVFAYLEQSKAAQADIVTANLFLHHFAGDSLARMFAGAARLAPLFVACEPERNAWALLGSRLLFAVGANDVTRHDAVASVRAGFRGRELSRIWPDPQQWTLAERTVLPFTHGFAARRKA